MKLNKTLLSITIGYFFITISLLYQVYSSMGGDGLGFYILLLFFQGTSIIIMIILTIINSKRWLNAKFGKSSMLMLLSYLVIPLLTYIIIQ